MLGKILLFISDICNINRVLAAFVMLVGAVMALVLTTVLFVNMGPMARNQTLGLFLIIYICIVATIGLLIKYTIHLNAVKDKKDEEKDK